MDRKFPNIKHGDVVLMKEGDVCRNDWPIGVIVNPILSTDGKVRKTEVAVMHSVKRTTFTRPITELVML